MQGKSTAGITIWILLLALIMGLIGGFAGNLLFPRMKTIAPFCEGRGHVNPPILRSSGAIPGNNAFADVAAQAIPTVVNIAVISEVPAATLQEMKSQQSPDLPDWLQKQFPFVPAPIPKEQRGVGSGVIVRADGIILTNEHVIKGAKQIKVTLSDGRKLIGKVIGRDRELDLAVVKVKANNLPAAVLGDSSRLRPGDWALTVGSPLGLSTSVTLGVISALDRQISVEDRAYNNLIQTDASIIPGNSGGPLINAAGEVVGINTAIQLTMDQQSLGAIAARIGFAVPINTVKEVLPDLIDKGKIVRPWVGIYMQDIDGLSEEDVKRWQLPQKEGIIVERVLEKSPAQRGGLFQGDIIKAIDGKQPKDSREVQELVRRHKPGETVAFTVLRESASGAWRERTVKVKTEVMPEAVPAPKTAKPEK